MGDSAISMLQLEGTIRGCPSDTMDRQEADENSSDCVDMMMNFGSDGMSEIMPNVENILTMPKSTPPPTISDLFCQDHGSTNSSPPDDGMDQTSAPGWYSGGTSASRYLDGEAILDDFEPAAKRSASGTPITGMHQYQAKQKSHSFGPYAGSDQNRDVLFSMGVDSKSSRPLPEGIDRMPLNPNVPGGDDFFDHRHKRKLSDRVNADSPRVTGLHLHSKNGAFYSKNQRNMEESDETIPDPLRVYRKTIMALGRENFFLKQQFGNANHQVIQLGRQLAVATEELQKLRSIVAKIGLGRTIAPDNIARYRGLDTDSFPDPPMTRMEEEATIPRPMAAMARQPIPDHDMRQQPPSAHAGISLGNMGFDVPAHQQPLGAQPVSQRRQRMQDQTQRQQRQQPQIVPQMNMQQPWKENDEEEGRWRWQQQLQQQQQLSHMMQQQQAKPTQSMHMQQQKKIDESCEQGGYVRQEAAPRQEPRLEPEPAAMHEAKRESEAPLAAALMADAASTPKAGQEVKCPLDLKDEQVSGADSHSSSPAPNDKVSCKDPNQPRFWTKEEHNRFLDAVRIYGYGNAREIASYVKTRSITQVRTHAQKYILKLSKIGSQSFRADDKEKGSGTPGSDATAFEPSSSLSQNEDDQSLSFLGEKEDSDFSSYPPPSPVARSRPVDSFAYHGLEMRGSGYPSSGQRGGGEDDPATWIESMELSNNTYLDGSGTSS